MASAAKKPLTRAQKEAEKVWNGLTARQQKALDPKKFEREQKAIKAAAEKAKKQAKAEADKKKAADKKAADKAKAAAKKATAKKATKKVAKKVVKKTAAPKVSQNDGKAAPSYEWRSLKTGRKVTESYAKANPTLVAKKRLTNAIKPLAPKAPAKPKKTLLQKGADAVKKVASRAKAAVTGEQVDAQPRITEARMEVGLSGSQQTYLIVAEKPKGNRDAQIGVRRIDGRYRIHAFPDFKSHGIDNSHYTSGAIRSATSERGQYQTRWVDSNEFTGFMNKLRESNQHAHIVDDLLLSRLGIKSTTEAVAA
ncbi:hypothetical protein DLP05_047 [Stenotrophomonas phage vB_SmaS_DLP_5]|uniref:Uncharacterized protein n=1 Tax=Stenotrophomonas phage vB_SmaS_DLP_5 TaxID=2044561 RepID=A0A2D2W2M2_9CAUD|nr:hypothetical protein FDJ07_gp046 [Stenotrophomonas phage vB_SmaS_DLP_5]ATS92300.1 hypothetical protein DLP05_047 [Stenotrophomonas phage vB_SmaS_DLP_5]